MNKDHQILASSVIKFLQDSCPSGQRDQINQAVDIISKAYDCDDQQEKVPLEKLYAVYKQTVKPSVQDSKVAEGLKQEGNKLLASKDFKGAVEKYTKAIEADPNNAVYYANRAAAYSQLQEHESAVYDAKKALQVNPNYSKAYSRLGHAEFCLGNYDNAVDAYTLVRVRV
jgi:tetratricopeptide (TPR) repeat protein